MPLEPVKQRIVTDPPTDPAAVPVPFPADSSFWSLPAEEQKRLMADLETYQRELPQLLQDGHAGKYALIKDGQVVSIHPTQVQAMEDASERFGLAPTAVYRVNPLDVDRMARLEAQAKATCRP